MSSSHSFDCLRVRSPSTQTVDEIASVEDAMVFLHEWPVDCREEDYRSALKCCAAAIAEQVSAEEARTAFLEFAGISGCLIKDDLAQQ